VLICSNTAGTAGVVFDALTEIAQCDPGLYMQTISSDPVSASTRVVYSQEQPGTAWSSRLFEIVSHPKVVVIYPGNGYLIEPKEHKFVSQSGGGVTSSSSDGSTAIYVDISDFYGTHYRVPAAGGGTVWNPFNVILAHELAHVYHNSIKGDAHGSHHDEEVQARIDENEFRSQIGLRPLRDIYSDDDPGQGQRPTLGGLKYVSCIGEHEGWDCGCNIATATLGSPIARQIAEFRRAKRELARFTLASVPLLQPMMDSYALFSPAVAGDVASNPDLRWAMLHFGVQPAVHLLQVVQAHINAVGDFALVTTQLGWAIRQYLSELPDDARQQVPAAAAAAGRVSKSLAEGPPDAPVIGTGDMTSEIFARVASAIRASGADVAGPAWVLDGLELFLRQAAATDRGEDAEPRVIGHWLARIPLPPMVTTDRSADIGHELDLLRNSLFSDVRDAELFESRLREHLMVVAEPSGS
jgi:hypothetical protein